MAKLIEKLKCNPLACMGIYLTILSIFFSLAVTGYFNLDNKITKIYELIVAKNAHLVFAR